MRIPGVEEPAVAVTDLEILVEGRRVEAAVVPELVHLQAGDGQAGVSVVGAAAGFDVEHGLQQRRVHLVRSGKGADRRAQCRACPAGSAAEPALSGEGLV